jgi:hypothetical protein
MLMSWLLISSQVSGAFCHKRYHTKQEDDARNQCDDAPQLRETGYGAAGARTNGRAILLLAAQRDIHASRSAGNVSQTR